MNFDPLLIAAGLICLVLLAWALLERRRAAAAEARAWELRDAMSETEVRARLLEEQAKSSAEFLKANAAAQASIVAEALVKRANETFAANDALAQEKLQAQLKPVAETLAKFQEQVATIEKERAEATGGLRHQLSELMKASVATQEEARKLSTALRRGAGVQGRWGEQMLRNVLEMAGLKHGVDYHEQVVLDGDSGRLRPDVVVKMPKNASFVIDAKCSFTAFEEGINATDEVAREAAFVRHAQSVRTHIGQLSGKQYWDALDISPDFVAMFVPGDGILSTALERAPELMTEAMEKRVIVVTPSTLFALCMAVAYGWRVEEQAKNSVSVAALGRDLHKRLADMATHASKVGTALGRAVESYNAFVGSLESRVLPKAREFEKLKVGSGTPIDELGGLENSVRPITRLDVLPQAEPEGQP